MHGCPASKTDKNLQRARKRSISRSRIWLVHASPANHNYTDLSLRMRFTRTYDPYQELPYNSFEECLMAALLVRVNQTLPRQKHGKSSSPQGRARKALFPRPQGRGSHDMHAEWRKAAGVRQEGKSFNSG
jgi:hypothetical protein